ncbi:MAG: YfdX family protein [Gallionellaceae bacterium]|nr:YfdX family protein [Gallionellaceae bacterium]
MINLRIKPLTFALITSFAVAQVALADATPRLHEDVSVTPGRAITPADEAVISSSANRVLHHLARARDALRKQDAEQAKQELNQAETLLDIIQDTVPTSVVKSRVWTANNKLQYENSEEVPISSVPIYASLDERADFDVVKLRAVRSATKAPGNTSAKADKKPATEEAEASDAALYYEEMDLPLNTTRHFVAIAQTELAGKHFSEADQALRVALDSVETVSVYLPAPLLAARINLQRAGDHYGADQKDLARADVDRAITQLNEAQQQADPASQNDVKKMLADAQSLQARIDKNEPGFKAELKGLWRRTKAHADRAMESLSVGWAKLRQNDPLRGALIEAKRYVAYADIDANVGDDPIQAKRDLEQARTWLEKAADATAKAGNGQDAAVYVKDIRAVVDTLLAGQSKPDKGELGNLEQQLAQAIARS